MKAKGKQLRRSKLLSGWLPIMTGTTILNICSVTGQTHTVTAVQMDHSRNVVQDDDHMVIWGLGGRYAWLSYPTHFQPILEPESIYYFAVSAYDTAGNSSGYSDEVRFYLTSINPLGVNPHFSPLPRLLFFGKEIALGNRGS
jgi:hypothetical protein